MLFSFFLSAMPQGNAKENHPGTKRMAHLNQHITSDPVEKPLRIGVIGLVHAHVHWILGREDRGDIEIAGIVEPNRELAQRYSEQHGYSMDLVFDTMEEMIEKTKPGAVTAFNTIYDHLKVVEYCAPRGIHVMVEKPLAVSLEHARKMADLAKKHGIQLLTNYETTWYGSHKEAYQLAVREHKLGDLRKLVFYTGHSGPIEIGCNEEFLEWLTDPVLNGGGVLTDFGCYGANLATWFMQGETPRSVSCVTQQIKPHMYPDVEDEAIIILTYPKTQVVIQASWNWSHNRKETEIYGTTGYVKCMNALDMEMLLHEPDGPFEIKADSMAEEVNDPFAYLASIINGKILMQPYDLSSLENNLIVNQILELAKYAAKEGRTILWDEFFGNTPRQ